MRIRLKSHLVVALGLTAIVLGACGSSSSNNNNNNTNTNPTQVTASAAFTQTDSATGVSIAVPAGAYDASATKPTFTVTKGTALPSGATVPSGTAQGPVYTITKDYTDSFLQPVAITVPYDPAVTAFPTVLHWDAANGKFQPAQILKIDATAKTVTFASVTFSAFAVVGATANAGTTVDSGFKPLVDGFYINNFGNYADPGKSSMAMSAISSWYFVLAKSAGNLYDVSKNNAAAANAIVNVVQKAVAPIWHVQWHLANYSLTPDQTGNALIQALSLTGQPQLLVMKSVVAGTDTNAVEVVVYKYAPDTGSTTSGKFYIYNPDFPGEETTLDWVSGTGTGSGFSNYSKAPAYSSTFTTFGYDALTTMGSNAQFNQGWQGVNNASTQNAITLTSPTVDSTGTFSQTLTGATLPDVQVTGSVTGGASTMTFTVNGGPLQTVTLASGGAFNFTLAGSSLKNTNTVVFTAGTIRNPYNISGFKALTIKFVGQSVATFTNFGFETGDKTGWTTETHLWNSNTDVTPTADDAVQRNFVGCPFQKAVAASNSSWDTCDYAPNAATALPACTATSKVGDLCYNEAWGTVIKFTPGTYPALGSTEKEKSAVVGKTTVFTNPNSWYSSHTLTWTAGLDPVVDYYQLDGGDKTILGQALNLPVYFNGSWAMRVNNHDNNNHASSVKQQTTIPNAAAPEIKFAWAAVLEDPGHENSGQPFVDVSVIDNDTGFVLYRKFFFSGNPEYSGWIKLESHSPTGTRWNVIPWQTVSITGAGLTNAIGHKVTIQVYASDCIWSGHGGYAYLDDAP